MVETNEIIRVERGIYILPTHLDDQLYIYYLKHKSIIYTGSVALSLNGMSNTSIRQIQANIPLNYNPHRIEKIKINRVNSKLYNLGKTYLNTSFGNLVPTYDKERVICDIYANNDLDLEYVRFAINKAISSGIDYETYMNILSKLEFMIK